MMGTFKSDKFIPTRLKDLHRVTDYVKDYFIVKGYEVSMEPYASGFFISLSKGGIFKSVLGMKTALNIDIKTMSNGVAVNAKVGIFGQQLIPSAISLFFAWPVLVTQITGLVNQAKLDDEAIEVIENAIHSLENSGNNYSNSYNNINNNTKLFCTSCGCSLNPGSKFCSECGTRQ